MSLQSAARITGTSGGGGGGVTGVTATAPIFSSGGTAPNISIHLPASQILVGSGTNVVSFADLTYTTTAFHVAFSGVSALSVDTNGTTRTTRLGYNTGNPGNEGTIIGAGAANGSTGILWTVVGTDAASGASGQRLTAFGRETAEGNTGDFVTAVGPTAAANNTGNDSNFFGFGSGFGNTGNNATGFSYNTLNSNTGDDAIAIGWQSGFVNTFDNVIMMGNQAAADQDNQFVVGSSGMPIPNWQINGIDYVMPSGAYVAGGALTDVAGNGTLTWVVPGGGGGAPIYPATLIPFGDGMTAGGITTGPGLNDPILAYDGVQLLLSHESGGGPSATFINAGNSGSTGDSSIGIGIYDNESAPEAGAALKNITSGSRDIAIGGVAGETVTNEHDNVFLGHGTDITGGNNNTINLGTGAISTMSNQITFGGPGGFLIPNWVVNGVNWVMPSANVAGVFTNDGSGNLSWSATISPSIIAGDAMRIPYFDGTTGLMTDDPNATRDNTNFFATNIAAGSGGGYNAQLQLISTQSALFFSDSASGINSTVVANIAENSSEFTDNATFVAVFELTSGSSIYQYNDLLTNVESSLTQDGTQSTNAITDGTNTMQVTLAPTTGFYGSTVDSAGYYYFSAASTGAPSSRNGVSVDLFNKQYSLGNVATNNSLTINETANASQLITSDGSTFLSRMDTGSTGAFLNFNTLTGTQSFVNAGPTQVLNEITDSTTFDSKMTLTNTGFTASFNNPGNVLDTNNLILAEGSLTSVLTDGSNYQTNLNLTGSGIGMELQNLTSGLNGTFNINNSMGTFEITTGNTDIFYQITPDGNLHYAFEDFASSIVSSGTLDITQNTQSITDSSTFGASLSLTSSGNTFSYTNFAGTTGSIQVNTTQMVIDISDSINFDTKTTQDASGYQSSFTNILTNTQSGFKASDQMITMGMLSGGNTSAFIINDSINESWLQGTYNSAPNSILLFANFASGSISLGDSSNSNHQTLLTVNDTQNKISLTDGLSNGSGIFYNGINSSTANQIKLYETDNSTYQLQFIMDNTSGGLVSTYTDVSTGDITTLAVENKNIQLIASTTKLTVDDTLTRSITMAGLYNGFINSQFADFDFVTGITSFGDLTGNGNGVNIAINDTGRNILMGGTYSAVPNSVFVNVDTSNGIVILGDFSASLNNTTLVVSDNLQTYTLNKLSGSGTRLVTADPSGVLGTGILAPTSGTYTPTLTNTTNITSSTAQNCQYIQVGNIVTVFGSVIVTTTLAVASTLLISLPVASTFAADTDLNGAGQAASAVATNAVLEGNLASNAAELDFIGLSIGGNGTIYFSFSYTVI